MAVILRSVSSCSFTDGARKQGRWTLIAAAGIGLDLGRDFLTVKSRGGVYHPSCRGLEKSKISSLLPWGFGGTAGGWASLSTFPNQMSLFPWSHPPSLP